VYGFVVNGYGEPIVGPDGQPVSVKPTATTKTPAEIHAKAVKSRGQYVQQARKTILTEGRNAAGSPIENPGFGDPLSPTKGYRYITAGGQPTNNPKQAARKGGRSYREVADFLYAQFAPTLTGRYAWTSDQVWKLIRGTLGTVGLKPVNA
jgi:hypothetical protein